MENPEVNKVYWIYKIDFGALKNQHIDSLDRIYIHYVKAIAKSVQAESWVNKENVNLIGVYDDDNQYYFVDTEFNVPFDRVFNTKEEAQVAVKKRLEDRCVAIREKIKNEYQKLRIYEEAVVNSTEGQPGFSKELYQWLRISN